MKVIIKDRIVAHRSAPDVYDPPTFKQMADCIEELEDKLAWAVAELERLGFDFQCIVGRELKEQDDE